jgi:hypothetical protein
MIRPRFGVWSVFQTVELLGEVLQGNEGSPLLEPFDCHLEILDRTR